MQRAANAKCSDLMATWIWVGTRAGREWEPAPRLLEWAPVCMPVGDTGSWTRSSLGSFKREFGVWKC